MTKANEQQTCADKVQAAWASRREDLEMMLDPQPEYLTINGERVSTPNDRWELGYGETSFEADIEAQDLFDEHEDEIRDAAHEAFYEYGLAFDYVAPGTFTDLDEGYWRYQISWGGPSEEIRFFANRDGHVYKAEFWYLDWFDGASVTVTNDEIVALLWDEFEGMGMVGYEYAKAMEDL